jgi:hypothetical protein
VKVRCPKWKTCLTALDCEHGYEHEYNDPHLVLRCDDCIGEDNECAECVPVRPKRKAKAK